MSPIVPVAGRFLSFTTDPRDSLGQLFVMLISSAVAPKLPHHPDLEVVDILAAADFGWEYLVREADGLWVLEELLPSAETSEDLPTLQAMLTDRLAPFQAIALPQFVPNQEFRVIESRLFWQRAYVAGKTYGQLLETAMSQDEAFTEDAVWDLLADILVPLAELHDRGLVHGAIEPQSIVCRESDGAIVLQRCGNVREFGLDHHFYQLSPLLAASRSATIATDLADLAALALMLLMGDATIDGGIPTLRDLQRNDHISAELATILTTMLAPKPWRNFPDAAAALSAIQMGDVAPESPHPETSTRSESNRPRVHDPIVITLTIVLFSLVGFAFWRMVNMRRIPFINMGNNSDKAAEKSPNRLAIAPQPAIAKPAIAKPAAKPQSEKQGIPAELYDRLIAELTKSEKSPDAPINTVLNGLSEEARREIGTYYRRNYDRWSATLAARKISQPTVDILADTAFYLRFPTLQAKTLNPRTFGQLWYAIARDQITDLNQQKQLKVLAAGDFNESGQLQNGQGRVFQVQLNPGDRLQLSLKADKQDVRLSVIENEIVLTRGSISTQWTAPPALRSTTYEIILTPLKPDSMSYSFTLQR
jgi:serine/threonine protein kinase, bacterial